MTEQQQRLINIMRDTCIVLNPEERTGVRFKALKNLKKLAVELEDEIF